MNERLRLCGAVIGMALISGCSSGSSEATDDSDAGTSTVDEAGTPSLDDAGTSSPGDAGDATDAGASPDASGPNPYADGEPIEGGPDHWTWVSFPESSCANGTPAGLAVSIGTTKRVFLYLEGGGACWSEATCFGANPTAVRTTTGVSASDVPGMGGNTPFNRQDTNNPFREYSFVYVPYCTGDVHAGDAERTYGAHSMKHFGRRNVEAFLHRLVPTFADAERVVLSGSSAGGFGSYLNFDRVQTAFREIPVDLIDDSGQPLPASVVSPMQAWKDAWNLGENFPSDCVGCGDSFEPALAYYATKYPKSRLALLTFATDPTIAAYMQLNASQFTGALATLLSTTFDAHPNTKYFVLSGSSHVLLSDMRRKTGGVSLAAWLGAMQAADPAWASVKP